MTEFFISFIVVLNIFVWLIFPWIINKQLRLKKTLIYKRIILTIQILFSLVSLYGIYKVIELFN